MRTCAWAHATVISSLRQARSSSAGCSRARPTRSWAPLIRSDSGRPIPKSSTAGRASCSGALHEPSGSPSSAGSAGAIRRGEVRKGGGAPLRGAMSLHRFHVKPEAVEGERLTFDAEEAGHMFRTLRLVPGDLISAVDGSGGRYTVRLERVTAHAAVGTILASDRRPSESSLAITLAQGVPKGDKLEAIIQAST